MRLDFEDLASYLERDWVEAALLQHQYFPNVRSDRSELPPFFTSVSLSPAIAAKLRGYAPNIAPVLEFRSRRYDGLIRTMGIPHPVPYVALVDHIVSSWSNLSKFLHSEYSMVKPENRQDRERLVIMDYESTEVRMHRDTILAQGSRFVVHADVANCFPSVYSHAIDWALRGKVVAKRDKAGSGWEPRLDKLLMNCHDGESKGVMIGPVISNIVAEVVLQRVDENLASEGFDFTRYVDDYTSYHATLEEAENFVARLDRALAHYRLQLNTRKTNIARIDQGRVKDWITEVLVALPRKKRAGIVDSIRFLRHCEAAASRYPQQSVLTFGVKTLLGKRGCPQLGAVPKRAPHPAVDIAILEELVRLTFLYPHLIPFTARQLGYCSQLLSKQVRERLAANLREVLRQAAARRETTTICWGIYAIRKILRRDIAKNLAMDLVEIDDDLVWLALAASGKKYIPWIESRLAGLLGGGAHEYVEHWLIRYELYRIKRLKSQHLDQGVEKWFVKARSNGLGFSILA